MLVDSTTMGQYTTALHFDDESELYSACCILVSESQHHKDAIRLEKSECEWLLLALAKALASWDDGD